MGKKHKNLAVKKNKDTNIISLDHKMRRINAKNILGLTPNELYDTWYKNKNIMENRINQLKNEIMFIQNRSGSLNESERYRAHREVEHKKDEIREYQRRFKEWIGEIENGINVVVKNVFQKLLKGASEKEISNIVLEFSNTFSESRYGDSKLEKILIYFVHEYKEKLVRERELKKRAIQGEMVANYNPIQQYYPNIRDLERERNREIGEYYDERDITGYGDSRGIDKIYDNNKQNMRFFSISIFYGSMGDKKKQNFGGKGKHLNSMLLGAFDAMSNFLYGNIQNALDELYGELKKK